MSPITTTGSDSSDGRPPWLSTSRPYLGKRRQTRRKLALDLIEAGLRILERDGPRLAGDQLTLAAAITELNSRRDPDNQVSSGSVYDRLWSSPDDYRVDVQSAALYEWFSSTTTPQQDQIAATVVEALEDLDLSSVDGRAAALREIIRRASFTSIEASRAYQPAQVRVAILAALAASPDDGPEVEQLKNAARAAHEETIDSYVDLYRTVLDMLHLRPLQSVFGPTPTPADRNAAIRIFTRIIITLNDGMDIRDRVELPDTHAATLPSGDRGQNQEWHHLGLGIWAIAAALTEPDTPPDTP